MTTATELPTEPTPRTGHTGISSNAGRRLITMLNPTSLQL